MTLYYDEEREALVENHPDEWTEIDEDGSLVFDLSDFHKQTSLMSVVTSMADDHDRVEQLKDSVSRLPYEEE